MLLTSRPCSRSSLTVSIVYQPHVYKHPQLHPSLYHNLCLEKHHNASLVRYLGYTCATLPILPSFDLYDIYAVVTSTAKYILSGLASA